MLSQSFETWVTAYLHLLYRLGFVTSLYICHLIFIVGFKPQINARWVQTPVVPALSALWSKNSEWKVFEFLAQMETVFKVCVVCLAEAAAEKAQSKRFSLLSFSLSQVQWLSGWSRTSLTQRSTRRHGYQRSLDPQSCRIDLSTRSRFTGTQGESVLSF